MKKFTLLNLLVLFVFISFSQTIIYIPDDYGSIQEGIDAASPGDTILVSPGTYVENVIVHGKHLVIGSLYLTTGDDSHIESTIIDGNMNGSVVTFAEDQHEQTEFTGFTITNGSGDPIGKGGGIKLNISASPRLSNLIIISNFANKGAGIASDSETTLHLKDVLLENNDATGRGGGVYANNANLHIERCQFIGNRLDGGFGGGLYYETNGNNAGEYDVSILSSEFTQNFVANGNTAGATIYENDTTSFIHVNIEDCVFSQNDSKGNCALSIYGPHTDFLVLNCTFQDNRAANYTAGSAYNSGCSGAVVNCLYSNNIADTLGNNFNGGAVTAWNMSDVEFTNCTFINNSASFGAGITVGPGSEVYIYNCIFWGNMYNQLALIASEDMGSYAEVFYSNIQYGEDSVNVYPLSTLDWVVGNIDTDPMFVGSGDHPFALADGSPCIDVGTPDTSFLNCPDWDLIYNERVWDGDGNGSAVIDMGPYEYGSVPVGMKDPSEQWSVLSSRCFPNPFSESTTIEYSLKHPAMVKLEVFNQLGQQVRFLVNSRQDEGLYRVSFDATELPSGLYFYRLSTGEKSGMKKIILTR